MLSERRLVMQSLRFYWRTNLAILLGVIAGTAVIGGALITGDSVRDSLRQMSLERLGGIDFALHGPRFLREDLAAELEAGLVKTVEKVAPALVLTGSFEHVVDSETRRAAGVELYGLNESGWSFLDSAEVQAPVDQEVVLNTQTASDLGVQIGDEVSLWIQLPSSIPQDSLLGERDETSTEIVLTVSGILPESAGAGRLALRPSQQVPRVAFLPLDLLQDRLELSEVRSTPRNPTRRPARVNAFFARAKEVAWAETDLAVELADRLNSRLTESLTLEDLGLKLELVDDDRYFSLTSDQMILERGWSEAARESAVERNIDASPVLVYLANEIAQTDPERFDLEKEIGFSMYSVIAGMDLGATEPPFGPFPVAEGTLAGGLADDEIVLNAWIAKDLQARVGDTILVKYHVVGSHGELPEESREFRVKAILAMQGATVDKFLVPEVEGITDIDSIDDWDQPFQMDIDRVTDRDDDYWSEYRALPKAFVSLRTAQKLWKSRYGDLTSYRFSVEDGPDISLAQQTLATSILTNIALPQSGIIIRPIKYDGLQAAVGANDFSQLFFAFSFFLILSAAILIGLLFRLGIERRASQIGLLAAMGFSPGRVRGLFLREALTIVVLGGVLGSIAAIGYAALMIHGLTTWWIGAIGTRSLSLSVSPVSVVLGFLIATFVTGLVTWWAMRQMARMSPQSLLSGQTSSTESLADVARRRTRNRWLAGLSLGSAGILLVAAVAGMIPTSEAFSGFSWQVVAFFVVGLCLLTGSLAVFGMVLSPTESEVSRSKSLPLARLGIRNAVRNRSRSVSTAGLIAFACFVIVAVAAGHRNPAVERPDKNSGNGGFSLVAESSQPILFNLNSVDGRQQLGFPDDETESDQALLDSMVAQPFRVKPGDNSSCLNLYRTQLPTILGVPPAMIERAGFKFADTRAENPWQLLTRPLDSPDGIPHIPVLGDLNTLQYSLKVGIGDTIPVPDAVNVEYRLQVVGMFDSSIFQGVLLMSEQNFNGLFADEPAGYRYFLVGLEGAERMDDLATIRQQTDRLGELLEARLNVFGFDAERVADRLAAFLEVQNTYLSTFQALGSLGLLLGTLGLSTVMLRNVLERRSELALMRAVGFRNRALGKMVLAENALLLFWGLMTGAVAALAAMLPHLLTTGADVPWASVVAMLAGVAVVGMLVAVFAVAEAVRTPIVSTLRGE